MLLGRLKKKKKKISDIPHLLSALTGEDAALPESKACSILDTQQTEMII